MCIRDRYKTYEAFVVETPYGNILVSPFDAVIEEFVPPEERGLLPYFTAWVIASEPKNAKTDEESMRKIHRATIPNNILYAFTPERRLYLSILTYNPRAELVNKIINSLERLTNEGVFL